MSTNIFSLQSTHISTLQSQTAHSLTKLPFFLNKELFFHAQQQLPRKIPNEHTPPSQAQLASKILGQLPAVNRKDYDLILGQIQHRMKVMGEEGVLLELSERWRREKEKICQSQARVKDYQHVYEEQIDEGVSLVNPLNKKIVGYFQTNTKTRTLAQMMTEMMVLIQAGHTGTSGQEEEHGQQQEQQQVQLQEQTRVECQQLLQQFKMADNMFNFQQ